jgi:photosystem II stability/assembly factor-like uncharacterized protein
LRKHCLVLFCFLALFSLAYAQIPETTYQDLHWRMIGPFRGGRTHAAAGVSSQPNVFYMGAVNGGAWRSDDYGRTWNPIFDSQPTQSIGDIAVAPSDPNIIYVASGEGMHRPDLSVGNGIYKSTDAGKTWTHFGLRDAQQIPALVIDPRDPNRLFAAVLGHPYGPSEMRGIFRSTDGGQTWQKILAKDENTGGSDIQMDPTNPDILYASLWEVRSGPWEDNNVFNVTGGGLFKSTDGGNTWRPLTKGLPERLAQINVAIAPSQPTRLYAAVATAAPDDPQANKNIGVYRSEDAGESWSKITTDPRPATRIGGGGELPVPKVDPKNPDVVYMASIVTMKSTDGGKTWSSFRGAPGGDDYQNLWINPNNGNIILLVSDQGAIVTVNGGRTWSSWFNQPTAQLYHAITTTNTFPYRVCAGQQESGSVCIGSRGNDGEITFRDWHPVGVIEYGYVAPDPLDPDIIYGAGRIEVSRFHWSTGQVENISPIPVRDPKYRADRTEPIMFSPLDPHTLYYATNVLFKTTNGGSTWETISPDLTRAAPGPPASVGKMFSQVAEKQRGVIYALAPSFKTVNTLWAGTDDGQVWITRDGGKNWNNITPPDLTPWSKVTQIQASRFDDQTAYISVSRFRIDDLRPYIYRTHDGGKAWQPIINGLAPDAPVDTVREDPVRKGLLFAGTEKSVWVSFDDGDHWQSLQQNLPHTSMRDLWIHDNDLIVGTHGRSFWILDDISALRQVSASTANADALFKPADAYRIRRSTNTDTPIPPDEPAGQNPPDGAILDYHLARAASAPVTIEIADSQGKLVRRFASNDQPESSEEELKKQPIPLYWIRMPKTLSAEAGMHRWVWDLHYPAPLAVKYQYPISAVPHDTPRSPLGPTALPGQYTVRLTANGKTYSAPLAIKMDPRVKVPPAGLQQQFNLEVRLAGALTRSSQALLQARSVQEQLKKLSAPAGTPAADAVKSFDHKLSALIQAPPSATNTAQTLTRLNTDLGALYEAVGQADAAPTAAQIQAADAVEHTLDQLIQQWDQVRSVDIPALNRQLKAANLPEIRVESNPRPGDSQSDDE